MLVLGCHSVTGPRSPVVTGVVRYPDGDPVHRAKIWAEGGAATFSDARGGFTLALPRGREQVTIHARDGYTPGRAYAVTRFTSVRIDEPRGRITRDLVLDASFPI
jgi:hypothetical protein